MSFEPVKPKDPIRFLPDDPTSCPELIDEKYRVKFDYDTVCIFRKDSAMFGSTCTIVLPKHGDWNCPCQQCQLYQFVKKWENHGFRLERILDEA